MYHTLDAIMIPLPMPGLPGNNPEGPEQPPCLSVRGARRTDICHQRWPPCYRKIALLSNPDWEWPAGQWRPFGLMATGSSGKRLARSGGASRPYASYRTQLRAIGRYGGTLDACSVVKQSSQVFSAICSAPSSLQKRSCGSFLNTFKRATARLRNFSLKMRLHVRYDKATSRAIERSWGARQCVPGRGRT